MPDLDRLSDTRFPITDAVKASINDAFKAVPDDKRGALLLLADENGARVTVAAKLGDHWKVAGGLGTPWHGKAEWGASIMGSW